MRVDELFTEQDNKTLYVCRHLVNTDEFIAWAKEQGFTHCAPAAKLHVTIAFSKEPVDWSNIKPQKDQIVVKGGMRKLENFSGANVLRFESKELEERWAEFLEDHDCSWDHPSYKPHITITYKGEGIDIRKMVPYQGELIFGPEKFKEIDTDYRDDLEETALTEDVMTLGHELDPERTYEIFKKSYEAETGQSWTMEKFLSRARGWTFYGDENGFVAVRAQRSGPKKLVGAAGNPFSVLKGFNELMAEGGPIWGAVSEPLARMAKKKGLIVPSFYPGGGMLIRALIATIPSSVFGGETPEVNKDGSITINYPDVGPATKYLIGTKAYFMYAMKLPEIAEKLKEIPGAKMLLKLMGLS